MSINITPNEEFVEWVRSMMQSRNWSIRETARNGDMSHSQITSVLEGTRVTLHVCRGLGKAFNVPTVSVLERAGLVEPSPALSVELRELIAIYDGLDNAKKQTLLNYARFVSSE